MSDEQTFSRGEDFTEEDEWKAELDVKLEGIFERLDATPEAAMAELAGPQWWWNIWARGPVQAPGLQPNRVIEVGEPAWIEYVVVLNNRFPVNAPGQNACGIITGFNGKIEIFFYTSNMQTMRPAPPTLSNRICIPTSPGVCRYRGRWTFTPDEAACLYEMNICARICTCENKPIAQYSGFVRWVQDFDWGWLFRFVPWTFDHPIRFMVADQSDCECP